AFGVVILDEAHKARVSRRTRDGGTEAKANNLMAFLHKVAGKAGSVLLGTATPIQLEAVELWDLMVGLGQGAPQVLGLAINGGEWWREASIQYLSGERPWPKEDTARWALFRNPLPPSPEHEVFRDIRDDGALPPRQVVGPRFDELRPDMKRAFDDEFQVLSQRHNPIVRRVVRRARAVLEERGLLKPITVLSHPKTADGLPSSLFDGEGLAMSFAFTEAYRAAEEFSRLYAAR